MAYTNNNGQTRVGVRIVPQVNASSLWNSIYSVYNADAVGSSSLKTSLFAAYNGESNANDSFGTNNGTAQGGLTYTTGKIGNAFQFNGSNSYVGLPVNSFKPTNTDFSISAWVNFSGTSANVQTIFSSISAIGGSKSYGIIIYYYNNRVDCQIASTSVDDFTSYNTTSLFNSWNLITFTRKAGSSSKLYINGSLVSSNSLTNNPTYPNNTIPSIGAADYNGTSANQYFCSNGTKIDALNIWNKELTASEVSELYNSGNGAQYIGDNFYRPTTGDGLYNNNGTAQGGLTYGLGKVGTAFVGNGTNAHVSFPAGSFNSLTTDFSVSAWVYLPIGYNNQNNCPIFSNMSAPGWFEVPGGFWLRFAGTTIQLAIGGKLNPSFLGYDISSDSLLNTWIHVVAVRKNNTSSKIYINNVLKTSNTDTVNPVYYTGVNLTTPTIGNVKMPNGVQDGYYAYNGSKIDAVGIWNKELTASEITELYNSGNGKQYVNTNIITNGLILNLDASNTSSYSGTGTTWTNLIDGNYNATLYNGVSYTSTNSGGLTFDGVNDYALLNSANKPSTTLANSGFSFGIWFSLNGWSSDKGILQIAYPNSLTSTTPTFLINTLNTNQIQYYIGSAGWTGNTTLTNKNAPQYFTFTISSNSSNVTILKVFINGVYQFMVNNPFDLNTFNNRDIYIGNGYNGCMSLNCYSVHMYNNKTLTDAEVLQNYINTKSRFGL